MYIFLLNFSISESQNFGAKTREENNETMNISHDIYMNS